MVYHIKSICLILFLFIISCKDNPTQPEINPIKNVEMTLSNGNFQLSWEPPDKGTSIQYHVFRRPRNTDTWSKLATVSTHSWDDTTLSASNGIFQYEYAISYSSAEVNEGKMSTPLPVDILTDNFNDGVNRWDDFGDVEDDTGAVVNGAFMIPTIPGRNRWCSEGFANWRNLVFEASLKAESTKNVGTDPVVSLICRFNYQDSIFNFYQLLLFTNSVEFDRYRTDQWYDSHGQSHTHNMYSWNKVRLELQDNIIKIYVNDQFLYSVTDSYFRTGKIALAGGDGINAFFDNVKILVTSWEEPKALPKLVNSKNEFSIKKNSSCTSFIRKKM